MSEAKHLLHEVRPEQFSSLNISFIKSGYCFGLVTIFIKRLTASKRPHPQISVLEGDGDKRLKNGFRAHLVDSRPQLRALNRLVKDVAPVLA